MTPAARRATRPALVLLAASLVVLPSLVFLAGRVGRPGDGARVLPVLPPDGLDGLVVAPEEPEGGPLRAGDLVVALAGRPVSDWLRAALTPGAARPLQAVGLQPVYGVRRNGQTLAVPIPLAAFPLGAALARDWSSYVFLVYQELVSLAVFARRPRLASAQILFLVSTAILASSLVYFLGLQASDLLRGWPVAVWLWSSVGLFGLLLGGLLHFILVFPDPRPALVRRPWLLGLVYTGVWLPWAVSMGLGGAAAQSLSGQVILAVQATASMSAVYFPLVLIVSFRRYRSAASEVERRQMRWVLWGLLVANVPWLALAVIPSLFGQPYEIEGAVIGLLRCAIPTAIAIAVLRERLFDIDLILRRTLVYSALTAALGLAYLSSVLVLQIAFRSLTGSAAQSQLAVVASTLAIAALFNPLRRRVQDFIDRRFYRRKYDAAQALAAFAATARDETDLDRLAQRLLAVVDETIQPSQAALWLRPGLAQAPPDRSGAPPALK